MTASPDPCLKRGRELRFFWGGNIFQLLDAERLLSQAATNRQWQCGHGFSTVEMLDAE